MNATAAAPKAVSTAFEASDTRHSTLNATSTRRELAALVHDRFEIDRSTLQVDHAGEELLEIEDLRGSAATLAGLILALRARRR